MLYHLHLSKFTITESLQKHVWASNLHINLTINLWMHSFIIHRYISTLTVSYVWFLSVSESSVGRVPTYAVTVDFLRVTSNCSVLLWLNIHRSLDKVRHYRYIHYNWHSVNQLLLMCKKILWVSWELERIPQCKPFYSLSIFKKNMVANNSWFKACLFFFL